MFEKHSPQVSVVIATLNRATYLNLCLHALTKQTASSNEYEIIVVDNGSNDNTCEVVSAYCESHINIRYILEPRQGLAIARNTGVKHSKADIIAFTDDDAIPDPSWVKKITERFANLDASVAVMGGEVRPIWEAPRPTWLTDALMRPLSAGLFWGPTARILRGDEWLVEVNIAYRKSRIIEFGGFPENLGRIGDSLLSGEGCINILLARAGLNAFYDPDIIVGHHIPAGRLNMNWFRRRFFWQGVSNCRVSEYIEETSIKMGLQNHFNNSPLWEEIIVPTSSATWTNLFDDFSETPLEDNLFQIEQLGYLLQSQSLISGR